MYKVYILECSDKSLYTGITTDLTRRLQEHNKGKASKYTRSKLPVKCIYSEDQENESAAKKREHEIKRWPRPQKLELIQKSIK